MDLFELAKISRALETSLDRLEVWLAVFTALVVVGLALEYRHEIKEFWEHVRWPMAIFPWDRFMAISGGILVTIGVAGELGVQFKASRVESDLRINNHKIESLLTGETSDAIQKSEAAKADAAHAQERAGKLEKEAAALRLENTRLEAIIQPRSLSLENQGKIVNECSVFRGHAVMVKSYGMDGEAYELGAQIIAVLNSAKMYVADDRATSLSTGAFETGIHVRGKVTELDTASCLARALRTIGNLTVELNDEPPPFRGAGFGGGGQTFKPGVPFTTVMIGVKPLPTLTRTKASK